MVKRKNSVAALLAIALSLSVIGVASKTVYASEYSSVSVDIQSQSAKQATDSNGVTWWYYKYNDGTICLDGTYDLKSVMEIPSQLDGYTVTGINGLLGYENTILYKESVIGKPVNKVIIPYGVKRIGEGAFARCSNLTEIQIPSTVKLIGADAFSDKWLEANRSSNGYVVVNGILVDGHKASGHVTIPSNIVSISDEAFAKSVRINQRFPNYEGITSVTIPSSVKRIGTGAFSSCDLTKAKMSEGLEVIADYAFAYCTKLTEGTIPQSVTELAGNAFEGDNKLKITNPNSNGGLISNNKNGNGAVISNNQSSQTNNSDASNKVNPGWSLINDYWYYGNADGTKKTGWLNYGGNWYYFYGNGQMATGFINLGGEAYYYLDESITSSIGTMKTGWQKINGYWYYFNTSSDSGIIGMMKKGWQQINGNWYYFYYGDGIMARNTWIDGYYVNSSGVWVR